MHIIRVNDSEGESAALLGDRIGQDLVGERQQGGEHYPNNHHHFPLVVHFSPALLSNFTLLSRCFKDNETCGLDVVRLSEAEKKKEKKKENRKKSKQFNLHRLTLSDFHPRLLLYSFFFFKLGSKRQRNVLISRIDRFQGRIFALGNFPLNKKENKLSRPFAATFSTSLIFVIVNETLRAFRGTIPAPLKRRERARCCPLPSSSPRVQGEKSLRDRLTNLSKSPNRISFEFRKKNILGGREHIVMNDRLSMDQQIS